MNRYLIDAMVDMAKVKAVAAAISELFMEDTEDTHQNLFLALCDELEFLEKDLDNLSDDMRVVDAIYAVNDAGRSQTTVT